MKSKISGDRAAIAALAAILIIGLLAACNPAPKYAKPPAQAPNAYKEAAPQEYKEGTGWKVAQPGDDKIRGKWWEMYNDPQLNALEEQVQISNQTIAASEANFRVARSLVLSGRAALLPVVTASTQYTNSRFSQTSRGRDGHRGRRSREYGINHQLHHCNRDHQRAAASQAAVRAQR